MRKYIVGNIHISWAEKHLSLHFFFIYIPKQVSDSPNTAGLDSRFLARNEEKLRKRSVFNGIPLSCVHSQQRVKAYQQLGPRHLAEQFLITPSYESL